MNDDARLIRSPARGSRDAMSDYPSSSQKRLWTLTSDEIEKRRAAARARAIDAATEARITAGEPTTSSASSPLSDDEETLLRRYYEVKIQNVCAAYSLPTKVQTTALLLFKRFLLGTSLLSHNLKIMLLTAVYVACKVEENYVSAEELGRGMKEDASRVLSAEVTLLSGVNFQLVTYSPYRAVEGFRADVEEKVASGEVKGSVAKEELDACVAAAHKITEKQMRTDAPLMFSPGEARAVRVSSGGEGARRRRRRRVRRRRREKRRGEGRRRAEEELGRDRRDDERRGGGAERGRRQRYRQEAEGVEVVEPCSREERRGGESRRRRREELEAAQEREQG